MIIQWYPGHMNKALEMMEKEIKLVDALLYVLDARAPFSCLNPKFTKVIGQKPIIYILNKCDLANPTVNAQWHAYFSKKGNACVMLNSTQSGTGKKVVGALQAVLQQKVERYAQKNITPTIRAMVLGVPNSGKSTLINNLCRSGKTVTGDKPGVTRGKQWVKIDNGMELLDTPGTLWPAFNNNLVAKHLAYIGSIKQEVLDIPSLVLELLAELMVIASDELKNRYNIAFEPTDAPIMVYEKICASRGYMLKGGEPDYERTAFGVLNDFKQNKLGKISLESVDNINDLLVNDRQKEED